MKHYFNLFVNKDTSMKASCVIHPDCEPMIIVREFNLLALIDYAKQNYLMLDKQINELQEIVL